MIFHNFFPALVSFFVLLSCYLFPEIECRTGEASGEMITAVITIRTEVILEGWSITLLINKILISSTMDSNLLSCVIDVDLFET